MNALEILRDAATRPRDAAHQLVDRLDPSVLGAHPGGHDNSVAWLLWHTAREIDAQVAHLGDQEPVWTSQGFRERFSLGEAADDIGYGHTPEQARSIVCNDAELLLDHLNAATDALLGYLGTLEESDLDQVIDSSYDPPVTRGARLVSIIDDAAQHLGQAAYIAGMPRRD
ncbi:DinB family protein [Brachybacterium muris]|uniref:mycothiol transferase n=1 Tax=Brachybacterium muris TaxID=219301 RepID=UPI0021A5E7D2|nr:DinB family protein [Brachybacterium muris]MCT1996616.1 DinB family protein [Brachybacterium muris]